MASKRRRWAWTAADRATAVQKIRDRWKSRDYKLRKDPRPNDAEADAGEAFLGLQPADETATLPLYVNSTCHTNPDSPSPAPSG